MPVSVTYPGVYVQEAPSGVRTISGVATSVAAFIGMTPAGPVNAPTRVFSAREFEAIFGGEADVGEMVHQVRQFFLKLVTQGIQYHHCILRVELEKAQSQQGKPYGKAVMKFIRRLSPEEIARAEEMRAFAQGFADRVTPDATAK